MKKSIGIRFVIVTVIGLLALIYFKLFDPMNQKSNSSISSQVENPENVEIKVNPVKEARVESPEKVDIKVNPVKVSQVQSPGKVDNKVNPVKEAQVENPENVEIKVNPVREARVKSPEKVDIKVNPVKVAQVGTLEKVDIKVNPVKQVQVKSPGKHDPKVKSKVQTQVKNLPKPALKVKPGTNVKEPNSTGKCPSKEPGHIPSAEEMAPMSRASLLHIFHNYGSNSEVLCQKMLRMGVVGDGGWEVCDDPHVRPPQNSCLVYSFGINNDFSFDDMMALHYGCEVHSFDPSMKLNTSRRSDKVMFHRLGIYGTNGQIKKTWEVNTLSKIRKDLGHSQRRIDVLKIDIEGNEWPTLKTVLEEGAFQNITQFLLEFHGGPAVTKTEVLTRLNYLRAIRLLGYRIFYAHKNPLCAPKYNALSKTPFPTDCYEIHTIKIPSCAV